MQLYNCIYIPTKRSRAPALRQSLVYCQLLAIPLVFFFFVYCELSPRRLLSANFINDFVAHFAAQLFAI